MKISKNQIKETIKNALRESSKSDSLEKIASDLLSIQGTFIVGKEMSGKAYQKNIDKALMLVIRYIAKEQALI